MTGPAPTKQTHMMVEAYISGATLCEVAKQFGVSPQRVHAAVERHAPKVMRRPTETRMVSVGKPPYELYRQGSCASCEVSLWGYQPTIRTMCGHCSTEAERLPLEDTPA